MSDTEHDDDDDNDDDDDAAEAEQIGHLVPLTDVVNARQLGDAELVHRTLLDRAANACVTHVRDDFAAGSEIFENYGKPNWWLFLTHGFVMQPNEFDCVLVPLGDDAKSQTLCVNLHNLDAELDTYAGDGNAVDEFLILLREHEAKYPPRDDELSVPPRADERAVALVREFLASERSLLTKLIAELESRQLRRAQSDAATEL